MNGIEIAKTKISASQGSILIIDRYLDVGEEDASSDSQQTAVITVASTAPPAVTTVASTAPPAVTTVASTAPPAAKRKRLFRNTTPATHDPAEFKLSRTRILKTTAPASTVETTPASTVETTPASTVETTPASTVETTPARFTSLEGEALAGAEQTTSKDPLRSFLRASTAVPSAVASESELDKPVRRKVRPSPLFRSSRAKLDKREPSNSGATRFDKFKNRVNNKEEEKVEKSILQASLTNAQRFANIQNKQPAKEFASVQPAIESTTSSTADTSQPSTTYQTSTTNSSTTSQPQQQPSTAAQLSTIASASLTDSTSPTPDIFALFSAAISSTSPQPSTTAQASSPASTTEALSTTMSPKEQGILTAFEQFVRSTEGKDTSSSPSFFSASESPLEFQEPEFPSHEDLPEKEIIQRAAEVLEESEIHSLINGFEERDSEFLAWLKKEVKERKQLGGSQFLNHLIESGIAKKLLPGEVALEILFVE